jgi:hypothetical protein
MDNNLIDKLLDIANRISRGEVPPYQHNECYTSGAFDLLLLNLNEADAFDLLVQLCKRYSEVKAMGIDLKGYYYLLDMLARQSDTTEMPNGMQVIIDDNPDLSDSLREWYRVAG